MRVLTVTVGTHFVPLRLTVPFNYSGPTPPGTIKTTTTIQEVPKVTHRLNLPTARL